MAVTKQPKVLTLTGSFGKIVLYHDGVEFIYKIPTSLNGFEFDRIKRMYESDIEEFKDNYPFDTIYNDVE